MMMPQMRQSLIIGAVVGAALGYFLYTYNNSLFSFLLIPFAAVMGAAPWLLKPRDD